MVCNKLVAITELSLLLNFLYHVANAYCNSKMEKDEINLSGKLNYQKVPSKGR
jgi:hypothetical protein